MSVCGQSGRSVGPKGTFFVEVGYVRGSVWLALNMAYLLQNVLQARAEVLLGLLTVS